MARHSEFADGPSAHLEYGLTHVGYDADRETHSYQDRNGDIYESEQGNRYGPLRRTYSVRSTTSPTTTSNKHKPSTSISSTSSKPTSTGGESRRKMPDWLRGGKTTADDNNTPPPAYTPRRRFTSFDMLPPSLMEDERPAQQSHGIRRNQSLRREQAPRQESVLQKLGRSLSVKKAAAGSGSPAAASASSRVQRRATTAGEHRARSRVSGA